MRLPVAVILLLVAVFMAPISLAQTHPFMIVKESDYPALQALSVGGTSKVPFIKMRTDAINISNQTTYNESAAVATRAGSLIKIMDSTALAYIVDPANRNTYRNRFYQYLKYWDLSQTGNLTKDLSMADWNAAIPPAAAFFGTLVAMDIIYNDPNTTAAQITQRTNFNSLMEASGVPGPPNTMGPATFFKTQYEPYHLESLMSARALWALWKDGLLNNTALNDAVAVYKDEWRGRITEDGCYREFGGYAMARSGDPSRYNKGVFHDVIVYAGIDPNWYSDPKMSKFYEWLGGYALAPNRHTWPIGDSSYCPFQATYASPFDRAGNFSPLGLAYGEWQQNGAIPPAKLFSYLARARATGSATALEPPSRIYADGAAYLRQKNGGTNALAAVLSNQKYTTVPNLGHLHRNTNSLNIASFGEILLRGPGYNGYGAAATDANNFGFDFSYLNNHAISENIALFNYDVANGGTYQNPSWVNEHRAKFGGYGVKGLLTDTLDYATCDSGLLSDANRAINNGRHIRHTIAVYPQDGVNGYVYAIDELEGNSSATIGQLAWHPYSDNITFNSDNSSDDRYEWRIHQKVNTTDQLYFSIFMPTAPNAKQQYNGLFADDIQGGASTSFVGKYIFNGYNLDSSTKKKNVLTMFFPRKSTQAIPSMARISPTGGSACQAAVFAFAGNTNDFAMESDGAGERTIVSATYDPDGAAARGKAVVYRKINGELAFYFVGKGRSFKDKAAGFTRGFVSDADIDIHVRGDKGSLAAATSAIVTFYYPGNFQVKLDGSPLAALQSSPGFTQVAIPSGSHVFVLDPNGPPDGTLFGTLAAGGTETRASPANPGNLFANPSFESGLASPWVPTNTDRVTVSNTVARTDSNSISIVPGSGGAGMSTTLTLKRNIPYLYSSWALEGAPTTNSYVTIYSATSPNPTVAFTGTSPVWQKVTIPFTPTSGTGGTQGVQFTPWFSSGSPGNVFFDDFELYELMAPATSVELGTRFKPERYTRVNGLRAWHPADGPGSYTLNLWDDAGMRIAQVNHAAPVAAGWVEAPLSAAVDLIPGRVYTVSFGLPAGFSYQASAATALSSQMIRPVPGGIGAISTTANTFPSTIQTDTNYWADVSYEFSPSPPVEPGIVRADFTDGGGSTLPQEFPGAAGDGWAGGWNFSASPAGSVLTDSPLASAGPYLRVSRTAGTGDQSGIYRAWTSTVPDDGFFRLTFDVRIDSDLTKFNTAADNLSVAGSSQAGAVTSNDSTFFIRAFGGADGNLAAREWGVFSGQPGVGDSYNVAKLLPSGMIVQPGTVYHFTIDVHAASGPGVTAGKTHGTYDVTISDGVQSVSVTGAGFRSDAFRAGGYLSFSTQQSAADDALGFSVDSIGIVPLHLVPPLTPLEVWENANFDSGDLANPTLEATVWGRMADPDRDGQSNLIEYSLGTNPNVGNGAAYSSSIITVSLPEGGTEKRLALTFLRARGDLTYSVQGCFDMDDWSDVEINPGAVGSTVTVPDTEAVIPGHRFLRLKVSLP